MDKMIQCLRFISKSFSFVDEWIEMDYELLIVEAGYNLLSKLAIFRVNGGDINNHIGTRGMTQTLSGKL